MTALAHSTARKAEHLRIAAGPGVQHTAGSGLDAVRLRHRALPGRDLDAVDLTTDLLGARLAAPLVVSRDDRRHARGARPSTARWRTPPRSTASRSCSARAARCSTTPAC